MRTDEQTSKHLLLAAIITVCSVMLILMTVIMEWELWMVPLIVTGMFSVWFFHIGRSGSELLYENLSAGLMLGEFFFFGIHRGIVFDIPAVACIMILIFSLFDRRRLLCMTVALYVLAMLYQVLILHSIVLNPGNRVAMRLLLGAVIVAGAAAIARYRIKKRRETRRKHEETFAQLETAGKQNAVFLSNVSHELRTPINMVIGISEVLKEREVSKETLADISSIQMAGRRLSNLINNMLDYTEIVEGTLSPAKEEYRFTSVLNDVLTIAAMQNSRSQLEMVFDVDPRLPSVLIGDAEKISHVLKILVENSIKFTEEGGIDVCVEFREEHYGGNLVIDIRDTGIGMTDSQLTQMYDDFYQADSGSSRLAGGLGLGLPIARGLLHAMGGFIYFDGKGDEGLQAHITIPQGVADDTPCMEITHVDQICIACYFRPEKYVCDEVRMYYDQLIRHMMEGLGIKGYQAHNFEGLLKLQRTYKLTHVFIAQTEYEENRQYYEDLADKLRVVVIAERSFTLDHNSRLLVIRKPFSALSVVNLLNGETRENGFKEAQVAGRKPFSCEGVRVLAVDDEEMNLMVAKGVLGGYGIQVDTCLSGKEAIEKCGNISYDVVFLDHMMPGFDGVETLKRIREMNDGMYRERPIIALTANTISGAREMFRNEGFSEFIPKPIERATLERVLRKVLPEQSVHYNAAPVNKEKAVVETKAKEMPLSDVKDKGVKDKEKKSPEVSAADRIKSRAGTIDMEKVREQVRAAIKDRARKTSEASATDRTQDKAETAVADKNKVQAGQEAKNKAKKTSKTAVADRTEGKTDDSGTSKARDQIRSVIKERIKKSPKPESPDRAETDALKDKGREGSGREDSAGKSSEPTVSYDAKETVEAPAYEAEKPSKTDVDQNGGIPADAVPVGDWNGAGSEEADTDDDQFLPEGSISNGTAPTYTRLKRAGINIKRGLDYCCGDEDFYMDMLRMFQFQSADKKAEIISLYEAGNWADYAVKVHALKSTSLTIGAERLSNYAKTLEHAGKREDVKYIRKNHSDFLRMYEEVCKNIEGV
ncbi:MAG: response regulator [Dorea sp.]|nr:response regulator [Dorea sp.]